MDFFKNSRELLNKIESLRETSLLAIQTVIYDLYTNAERYANSNNYIPIRKEYLEKAVANKNPKENNFYFDLLVLIPCENCYFIVEFKYLNEEKFEILQKDIFANYIITAYFAKDL